MRKHVNVITSILVFMMLFSSVAQAALPATPAQFNTNVAAPTFTMTAIGGQTLTSSVFGKGKNILLVYGRVYCYNTQSFLYGIQEELDQLAANNITVLVGLHDDPDDDLMIDFSNFFGGITCCRVSNDYYESGMWTGLDAVGAGTNSVTFPVIFLRSADERLRYYSTDYVDDPSSVVAAAIVMSGGDPLRSAAEIKLPDDLTSIQDESFRNDSFSSVFCPESITSIGAYAFAENTSLEWIYLPSSVKSIDNTAFWNCSPDLVIYGQAGSSAQRYAEDSNFEFRER